MKYKITESRLQTSAECRNLETALDITKLFITKYGAKKYDSQDGSTFKVNIEITQEED